MNLKVSIALLTTGIALLVSAGPAAAAYNNVPTPEVTGPVPVTASSHPFLATDIDLAKYGYVEKEYFISGDGHIYDSPSDISQNGTPSSTGGPNGDGTYPFKTRIVVRRPANPADANGKVVAEWNNVTATQDIEWNWFGDPYYMLKHGYTFVGVTAQNTGVNSLKAFNPTRYGDLTVNGNDSVPTGPGLDSDALSYDVYSSAIKAIRGDGTGVDPMGGISPNLVIASGESQSCGRLASHYNKVEPLQGIVDAYLLTVCKSPLRTDRPEKVVRVVTETENRTPITTANVPDNSTQRLWEVAAASHLPRMAWDNVNEVLTRDFTALTVNCQKFPLSLVQWPYTVNRAIDDLGKWVDAGEAPPVAPRGEYVNNPDSSGPPQILQRDQYGIALGAIRYPEVTVPTATNDGTNAAAPGGSIFSAFCGLLGSSTPFTQDQLSGLYHDYADYVAKYAAAADIFSKTGFILPEDVERLKEYSRQFAELRPSVPVLVGQTKNKGSFSVQWQGTQAPDTKFELQSRTSAKDAAWETVSATLTDPMATLAKQPQGTLSYRANSTTVLPATNISESTTAVTPFSDELGGIKVDRTGPQRPRIIIKGKRVRGAKKTYKGHVKVRFKGRPDFNLPDGSRGVGLKYRSVPKKHIIRKKGRVVIKARTRDRLGNRSKTARKVIRIRKK